MSRTKIRIDAVAFTLLLVVALMIAPVAGTVAGAASADSAAVGTDTDAIETDRTAPAATETDRTAPAATETDRTAPAATETDRTASAAIDGGSLDPTARTIETTSTNLNSNLSFALDGTTLEVSVDAAAFEGNDTSVNVTVADESPYEKTGSETNGTYTYDVDLTQRSFDDLSNATITVRRGADGESLGDGQGSLWYVDLASDGAKFDGQNRLLVPIDESVGLAGNLQFSLSAGSTDRNVYARAISGGDTGEQLEFVRGPGIEALIETGEDIEIAEASGETAPRVGPAVTVPVTDIAGDPDVSLDDGAIVVSHDLIVNGSEYVVTMEGTIGDRTPITTQRMTADSGGELRFTSEGLVLGPPGSNVSVTIDDDDRTIGSGTTPVNGSVLNAQIDENTSVVTVVGLTEEIDLHPGAAETANNSSQNGGEAARPTVDVYVSWENRSGEPLLIETVPVDSENETLAFPAAGYELTGTGHTLLIATDQGETAVASVEGPANTTGIQPAGAGGIAGRIGIGVPEGIPTGIVNAVVGFLAVLLIGGMVVGVFKLISSKGSGGSGGHGRSGAGGASTSMTRIDVSLVDDDGNAIDATRTVVFEPTGGLSNALEPQTRRISGSQEVQVPSGQYYVQIEGAETGTTRARDQGSLRVTVPPRQYTVTVRSARGSQNPISDAEIRCRTSTDVITTDANGEELRTDSDGTATLELPPTADPQSATIVVEHERYETTESEELTIAMEPKTGAVTVETGIDGQAAGNVPVSVQPTGEFPRANGGGTETRSDENGTVTIDDLVIGTYQVTASFSSDAIVDVDEPSVEVVPDEPRRVSIDGAFDFDLAPYQDRIDELNEEIADLTRSNRDGAIQYYYGSVLTATLDLLSTFPDQGLQFVEHGVDPDELTEAVLAAVADAIEYTRDAMTTKQNVDLFGACSSLRNERIRWDGDPSILDATGGGTGASEDDRQGRSGRRSDTSRDRRSGGRSRGTRGTDHQQAMLEELIAVVATERADHRGRTADRLEETEEFLSDRRGEVATVSPVREQYDRIKRHLSSTPGETRIETRVQFVVATWMLDAVRRVFDHPELVDRLEETVF